MRAAVAVSLLLLALTSCRTAGPQHRGAAVGRHEVPATIAFYAESKLPGASVLALPESGVRVGIDAMPVVRADDILRVDVVQAELGKCLVFEVTARAADELSRLEPEHGRVVLVVNGMAYGARRIDEPFRDGRVYVFPEIPDAALPHFADELRSGLAAAHAVLTDRR